MVISYSVKVEPFYFMIQILKIIITNLKFLISKKQLKPKLNNYTIGAVIYPDALEMMRMQWLRCGIY